MPDRRKHIELDLMFIKTYNLKLTIDDIVLIESLIDDPSRYATIMNNLASTSNCKSRLIYNIIESRRAGLEINGVFKHDWGLNRARRGKSTQILKKIVSCIFGDDAILIVDLHSSIDMIHSGRLKHNQEYKKWASNNKIDPRVIEFVETKLYPHEKETYNKLL